jgi:hypothetical protein
MGPAAARNIATAIALSAAFLTASSASAQSTRTEEIELEKGAKAASVEPPHRETGDRFLTTVQQLFAPEPPALKLSFGGFRPGAGLAPGVAWTMPTAKRGLWTTKAAWSVRNFKLFESSLDLPRLADGRLDVRPFARWEDAPTLDFFGVGPDTSRSDEVSYGLRSSEAGIDAGIRVTPWLNAGGGFEYLDVRSTSGDNVTGPSSTTAWLHATTHVALDTRTSGGYTDRGSLARVSFDAFSDRAGRDRFRRTDIDVRHFIPLAHDNWIVALQGRADFTGAADGQVIPFFMLPYVGSADTLRGFSNYRFTDRDALLLRGELRWTPASILDMAVFMDEGNVAPTVRGLGLQDLKRGWGVGARFHGDTFSALRLEVAHSVEGWHAYMAQNISF